MGMTTAALNGGENVIDPLTGQGTEVNPSDYSPSDYEVSPLEQDMQMVIQLLQEISAKLDKGTTWVGDYGGTD